MLLLPILTTVLVVVLDQVSKAFMLPFLAEHGSVSVVSGVFHLTLVQNTGVAFGFFQGMPHILTGIITVSVLVFTAGLWWVRQQTFVRRMAYGFILGGAIGNWMDRLRFEHVIDFLDFRVWPVFNVADSFITIGVCIFIVLTMKGDK